MALTHPCLRRSCPALVERAGDYCGTCLARLDALSEQLMSAMVLWLVAGRGAEGMSEPELYANLRRLPSCRWLALWLVDQPGASAALHSDLPLGNLIAEEGE